MRLLALKRGREKLRRQHEVERLLRRAEQRCVLAERGGGDRRRPATSMRHERFVEGRFERWPGRHGGCPGRDRRRRRARDRARSRAPRCRGRGRRRPRATAADSSAAPVAAAASTRTAKPRGSAGARRRSSACERAAVDLEIPAPGGAARAAELGAPERHVAELAALALRSGERLPVDDEHPADPDLDGEVEHDAGAGGRASPRLGEAGQRRVVAGRERKAAQRPRYERAEIDLAPAERRGLDDPSSPTRCPLPRRRPPRRGPPRHGAARRGHARTSASVAAGVRERRPTADSTIRPPSSIAATRQPGWAISTASTTGPLGCGRSSPDGRPRRPAWTGACSVTRLRARSRAVISVVELVLRPSVSATCDLEIPGRSCTRRRTASAPAARRSAAIPGWWRLVIRC